MRLSTLKRTPSVLRVKPWDRQMNTVTDRIAQKVRYKKGETYAYVRRYDS